MNIETRKKACVQLEQQKEDWKTKKQKKNRIYVPSLKSLQPVTSLLTELRVDIFINSLQERVYN